METIRVFSPTEKEYRKLEYVAKIMTMRSENGVTYEVGDTCFDFGQGWEWTTILAYVQNKRLFQALSPAEREKIVTAKVDELYIVAQELMDKLQKERPRLYSFRKGKKKWTVTYTRLESTTFTVEADDLDEALEEAERYADEHWEELDEEINQSNDCTYGFSNIKEEK